VHAAQGSDCDNLDPSVQRSDQSCTDRSTDSERTNRGAQVKNFARVADSIIGWGSSIGRWARIDNKSVIGEDVHIKARAPRGPRARPAATRAL